MKKLVPIAALLMLAAGPAIAHVGHGSTASFTAGLGHPFGGLDHVTVMLLVGLWAGLKGGRALWVWPSIFVGVMLIGGILGMEGVPLPFVEPVILASVVALGLLVALAVDLPVPVGAAILAVFATISWPCAWHRGRGDAERRRVHGWFRACHSGAASCRNRLCGDDDALLSAPRRSGRRCAQPPRRGRSLRGDSPMIPGEMFIADGEIELNAGRKTLTLTVSNTGDRPIQVGSHYHFFETNPALSFDRKKARGMRLDIAAGTAVRFEPGQTREVTLVALAGKRTVYGFRQGVMGKL